MPNSFPRVLEVEHAADHTHGGWGGGESSPWPSICNACDVMSSRSLAGASGQAMRGEDEDWREASPPMAAGVRGGDAWPVAPGRGESEESEREGRGSHGGRGGGWHDADASLGAEATLPSPPVRVTLAGGRLPSKPSSRSQSL